MVETQLARRGIADDRVLDAMRRVPREAFVDEGCIEFAYEDAPLPISDGQTISQPFIVALMIQAAEIEPGDKVLEVGAGSGYAAAVTSRIAGKVFAVERHPGLGQAAMKRMSELGYDNVEVRVGDGTRGWPETAPFDAILVSAGGPSIPPALREQLVIGGRLVIPIGEEASGQRLLRITRLTATRCEEEDLGGVRFVPLIGEEGWAEDGRTRPEKEPEHARGRSLPQMIGDAAEPLPDFEDPAFGRMFDRYAGRRVVLLGEASHGTSEFYRARAAITRHLVEHHGFGIVAVEADWPDAAAIDRYVRGLPHRGEAGVPFQRFPTWMWRNTEVSAFVDWLYHHNQNVEPAIEAGRVLRSGHVQHERLHRGGAFLSGPSGP